MIAALESMPHFAPAPSTPSTPARPRARLRTEIEASIRQIQDGSEEAARSLMDRLYPLVVKLVRAYLPRRMGEEDLVQMIFIKIFTRLDQYSGLVPIEHWVSRIAVNTCLNQLNAEKIRPELRWADLSEQQQYAVESLAAADDRPNLGAGLAADLLTRLLDQLSPSDRLIVQLLHIEEKSISEISALTGWTIPVIKVRAFRARNKLRNHLRALESRQPESSSRT